MPLPLSLTNILNPNPGWYRGDFHCHTNHSDGVHPPPELAEVARREGLEFFFITDHNAVSAYGEFGEAPGVLILPGIEVTYKRGHWNIFGLTEDGDWLKQVCGRYLETPQADDVYPTANAIMQHTAQAGLLNSINHPLLAPWAWEFADTELRHVHALEIWNDPSWPDNARGNPRAVALWTRLLNDGWRITALGGSDYHRPHPPAGQTKPDERLGLPSTYVYADNLCGAAILDAVRRRRAYVSAGPRVTFTARFDGVTHHIGADLGNVSGAVELKATVSECPPSARALMVRNGHPMAEVPEADGGINLHLHAGANRGESAWFRCEVFDAQGELLAITNPIFHGPPPTPSKKTFGEYLA
ncbi:MAG: CehA/McbA family metallohydrolase [Anaerolineales bacterium]